jgi:hypothetical protein
LPRRSPAATILAVNEELGIYRGEVLTIMEALADLRVDVTAIRSFLLEEDDEGEEEGPDGEV